MLSRASILPSVLTPAEAIALQKTLAAEVRSARPPLPKKGMLVAGADCSYEKRATTGYAAIVVCRWPEMEVIDIGRATLSVPFPYVPGLLSFRELPLLDQAWLALSMRPDMILIDGHGRAHPRRFGLACHAGLLWDCPTVGSAKSLLIGEHGPVGERVGSRAPVRDRGEVIGAALRTREAVKPVYVSTGNRVNLPGAVRWVLASVRSYRVPVPIRLAHLEVNRMRRSDTASD